MLLLAFAAPAHADDVGTLTAEAYAAWKAEDAEAARALATRALAADPGEASLTARKLLVLALEALDEPAAAMGALDDYRSFPLVEADRRWADEAAARIAPSVPPPADPEETDEGSTEPPPEPLTEPGEVATEPATVGTSGGDAPPLVLGLGGGYRTLGGRSYVAGALDLSGRIAGPLRLVGGAELALSEPAGCGSQPPPDGDGECRSLLPSLSIGVGVRAPTAPAPFADARFLVAPHGNPDYVPVQAGGSFGGGVELAPAASPVALRVRAALDLLSPLHPSRDGGGVSLGARVFGELAVRFGE